MVTVNLSAVKCRLMPPTFIARRDTAFMLAAARLALAQQLSAAHAQQPNSSSSQTSLGIVCGGVGSAAAAGFADAALAALPRLLDDAVLLRELMAKWTARVAGLWEVAKAQAKVRVKLQPFRQGIGCCC